MVFRVELTAETAILETLRPLMKGAEEAIPAKARRRILVANFILKWVMRCECEDWVFVAVVCVRVVRWVSGGLQVK